MPDRDIPAWILNLDEIDLHFVKRFVLASGSLKDLAAEYEVSYPTIRLRLDRVIERIRRFDKHAKDDAFEAKVRLMVAEGSLDPRTGKELLRAHRSTKEDPHG